MTLIGSGEDSEVGDLLCGVLSIVAIDDSALCGEALCGDIGKLLGIYS